MNPLAQMMINQVLGNVTQGNPQMGQLLNAVVGMLTQGQGQAPAPGMAPMTMGMAPAAAANPAAALMGLVQQFEQAGLGQIIGSWVSTGQNQPITAQQVQQGLGEQQVQQLAQSAGLSPDQASSQLAQMLPNLVDKLTPSGAIDPALINQVLALVSGKKA